MHCSTRFCKRQSGSLLRDRLCLCSLGTEGAGFWPHMRYCVIRARLLQLAQSEAVSAHLSNGQCIAKLQCIAAGVAT